MAAPLPPGELEYQFAHIHQSSFASIVAVNISLPLIATVFVFLRMTAQKIKKISWQADDYVILAALLVTYMLCIELILCAHFGMGHHLLSILKSHPQTLTSVLKTQFAIDLTWNINTYLVKLANIMLLARLFAGPASPHFRLGLHLVHSFLFLWTTASFFSILFQCSPIQSFWDLNIKGNCPHAQMGRIITAALNLITDVILLSLPMRPIWQLHMPVKQKLAVVGVFVVGIICLAASAMRLDYSIAITQHHGYDPTYMNAPPMLWASVELCIGLVCACLPLLRPLLTNLLVEKLRSWFSKSLFSRGSKREADTWWHPPPEEIEIHIAGDIESRGKRANSDWSFFSSGEQKMGFREEVMIVTEIRETVSSMDGGTEASNRGS